MVEDEESGYSQADLLEERQGTALMQVAEYAFSGKGLPTRRSELIKQAVLLLVSVSGSTLYGTPAYQYATDKPDLLSLPVNNKNPILIGSWVSGTAISALAILYNATDIFLTLYRNKMVPSALKTSLKERSKRERYLEGAAIILVSSLASVPFTMLTITYPLVDSLAFKISYATVVEVDNTILHLLPVELILNHPFFSWPLRPFRFLKEQVADFRLTEEQRDAQQRLREREARYLELKQALITRLDKAQQTIMSSTFQFSSRSLAYQANLPNHLTNGSENQSGLVRWLKVMRDYPASHQEESDLTVQAGFLTRLHSLGRYVSYGVGMGLVLASCIGYLADPINEVKKMTGSYASASSLMAVPDYCLGTLLAYFGGETMRNLYDYFTNWQGNNNKIPTEVKLYPKTFLLFMLFNSYLCLFSSAAAKQLVLTNFSDDYWTPVRRFFLECAEVGITFLSFFAVRDFVLLCFKKITLHYGSGDAQLAVRLSEQIDQLKNYILLMDGKKLVDGLLDLEVEDIEKLSGFSQDEFTQFQETVPLTTPQQLRELSINQATNPSSFFNDGSVTNSGCNTIEVEQQESQQDPNFIEDRMSLSC